MTMSIEMCVRDLVLGNPDKSLDELRKEIGEKWVYGQEDAVKYLKENYEKIKKGK